MSFRIMPKQEPWSAKSGVRYGFPIPHHPLGDSKHDGLYIALWNSWDEAIAAAFSLNVDPHQVQSIGYIYPEVSS